MINSHRVCAQVQSTYVETQSQPEKDHYVFAYSIRLHNLGRYPLQLIGCYWLITNTNGQDIEVQAEGVLGKKPLILPSSEFQYGNAAVLETRLGTMQGHYMWLMIREKSFTLPFPSFAWQFLL